MLPLRSDDARPSGDLVAGRLQGLASVCAALLAGVVLDFALLVWQAGRGGAGDWMASPETLPFSLALGAMILILLSSGVRSKILRQALASGEEGEQEEPQTRQEERLARPEAGPLLAAYTRATLASFAILELAAAIGLGAALANGSVFYGLIICATSAAGMLARWPRRAVLEVMISTQRMP
jgi:hypothetical protein